MYVTRPISRYLDNPQAAAEPPPEGPGSGILVVEDEEAIERATCCWGLCRDRQVYGLPFPQNRKLKVKYSTTTMTYDEDGGMDVETETDRDDVVFVPVLGQPLSSNRYYVVRAEGKHIGKVAACSREEDKTTCCFCSCVNDVPPRPFDHRDVYQQVEVVQLPRGKGFTAEAIAPDGIPPEYLRRKGWQVHTSRSTSYELINTEGMDSTLRYRMPDFDPAGAGSGAPPVVVVVAKWYCPFMFVSEGGQRLKDQVRRCMFYEMTLEQNWEEIYSRHNLNGRESTPEVAVSATVHRSKALLNGKYEVQEGGPQLVDGVMWFRPAASSAATGELGLSVVLWERMRWELERGGWVSNGDVESIERVERCEGLGGWETFGCFVLVERFVLRRMDGNLALTYEFKHTNKIRTKWA